MAFPIRYLVPYEVNVHAHDLTTLKELGNTFYLSCGTNVGGSLAYGVAIPGPSSTAFLLGEFDNLWASEIMPELSVKYQLTGYTMRAILGKRFATPTMPIASLVLGNPVTIATSGPHGLVTGDGVLVSGVVSPITANGVWIVTVLSPTVFTLNGSNITGVPWTTDGYVQQTSGRLDFIYADKEELPMSAIGAKTGDTMTMFTTVSVRRLNAGVGRNFRSHFGISGIPESSNDFGKLTTAAIADWAQALIDFNVSMPNNGSDAGSGNSFHIVMSKQLAMSQLSPFTSKAPFSQVCDSMTAHDRLGSQILRKPRLS